MLHYNLLKHRLVLEMMNPVWVTNCYCRYLTLALLNITSQGCNIIYWAVFWQWYDKLNTRAGPYIFGQWHNFCPRYGSMNLEEKLSRFDRSVEFQISENLHSITNSYYWLLTTDQQFHGHFRYIFSLSNKKWCIIILKKQNKPIKLQEVYWSVK